jgi:hypothetical protein
LSSLFLLLLLLLLVLRLFQVASRTDHGQFKDKKEAAAAAKMNRTKSIDDRTPEQRAEDARSNLSLMARLKQVFNPIVEQDEFESVTTPFALARAGMYHDMTSPLSHYFIFSGHNTFLTGNQVRRFFFCFVFFEIHFTLLCSNPPKTLCVVYDLLIQLTIMQMTSKSSIKPIIDALQNGCRVLELDVWSGRKEPKVVHGQLPAALTHEQCPINSIFQSQTANFFYIFL